jgi:hypothetical protein
VWTFSYGNRRDFEVGEEEGICMTEERSNRWKQRNMRSFRVSKHLHEMIKLECKRRKTNFSSFIRTAALDALRNRTYQ